MDSYFVALFVSISTGKADDWETKLLSMHRNNIKWRDAKNCQLHSHKNRQDQASLHVIRGGDDDWDWWWWGGLVENDVSFKFGDGANFGDNSSQRLQPTHCNTNHPNDFFMKGPNYAGGTDHLRSKLSGTLFLEQETVFLYQSYFIKCLVCKIRTCAFLLWLLIMWW